jgi:hypothetical protein
MGAVQAFAGIVKRAVAWRAEMDAAIEQVGELERAAAAEEFNATSALLRGAQEAGRYRARGGLLQGQQATGFASGNVDASSGSAADVQDASRMLVELDAQTARNNAIRQAFGHKAVARRYLSEVDRLDRRYGIYGRQGFPTATAELLGNAGLSALELATSSYAGGL